MTWKHLFGTYYYNLGGWTTKRKICVVESDDWGSIRMPSQEAYYQLQKIGLPVERNPYCRLDTLECADDLTSLFDVLAAFKDFRGNSPVITANTVMTNPDFASIRKTNYSQYSYELFTDTLTRLRSKDVCELINQGRRSKIFVPQFHGREHVNCELWMKLLRQPDERFRRAFDLGMWSLTPDLIPDMPLNIQASYDMQSEDEFPAKRFSLEDGLRIFENIFQEKSSSCIFNNFIWDDRLHAILRKAEVKYIQGMRYRLSPKVNRRQRKKERRFLGQRTSEGQINLIRNCTFEPALYRDKKVALRNCMSEIQAAFQCGKPAIIGSHRLNFIGSLSPSNRTENLLLLRLLFKNILAKWPEVEFVTSSDLGGIMETESK